MIKKSLLLALFLGGLIFATGALAQSPSGEMGGTGFTTTSTSTATTTTGTGGTGGTGTTNVTLMCTPQTQTTTVGRDVFFSATGGTGTYTWSVPEITLANPVGTGLRMNYGTPGLKTVTVTSGGQTSICLVTVTGGTGTVGGGGTPGFPNTGEGGNVTSNLLWFIVGLSVVGGVSFLTYKGLAENK